VLFRSFEAKISGVSRKLEFAHGSSFIEFDA